MGSEKAANDCLQKWKLIRSFLPRTDEMGISRIIFRVAHIIEAGCRLDGIPGLGVETIKILHFPSARKSERSLRVEIRWESTEQKK